MKRKLLVVFVSRYGQTEKIARRIGAIAQEQGVDAEVLPVGAEAEAALTDATDVVVAGAIYFSRHDRLLARFVRDTLVLLLKRHAAFVTVCGAADDRKISDGFVSRFLTKASWTPDATAIFAGATSFTRYGWLIRFMMRRIARSHGAGADTSRDYEYTDWTAVETFARAFVAEDRARVA